MLLLLAAVSSVGLFWALAGRAEDNDGARAVPTGNTKERTYPSLPGAMGKPPDWLTKNAPFDVDAFFADLPIAENAAPFYLEALYEFLPSEMAHCFAAEVDEVRGAELREREDLARALQDRGTTAFFAQDLLKDYAPAFQNLSLAQKRKRCAFDVGFSLEAMYPHAQAARAVARLINWRVELAVSAGRIDPALDDIEMALRLSRDLRQRGPVICQLVSISIDTVIVHVAIYQVLSAPDLKIADCDKLLDILARQIADPVDPLAQGFRGEYLSCRELLYRLQNEENLGEKLGSPGSSNGTVLATILAQESGGEIRDIAERIDEALADMTRAKFESELDALNRYFRPLVERGERPARELDQLLPEQERAVRDMKLLPLCTQILPTSPQTMLGCVEAWRRDSARMGATQCLVALRRWRLTEPDREPPDLLTLCEAAGIKSVPVDEYSRDGGPLRSRKLGEQLIIYSVARDGIDDKAEKDWGFGHNPGDWPFWLPSVRNP